MPNSKLSIIIPIYNIEKYIDKCIKSVVNQTYRELEIILVDDGSEDNSPNICDEWSNIDDRIIVIHKINEGVSLARLTGINVSTGDYIGFVDGDDTVEPNMFEILMNNAKNYNADISHCGYTMVFPDRKDMYYGTSQILDQNNKKGLIDLLNYKLVEPSLCNKIYRSSIFNEFVASGIMNNTIKNNEDLLMNYYLFKLSRRSIFVDKCLYNYMIRRGSASKSSKSINTINDPLTVSRIILNDTKNDKELHSIVFSRFIRQLCTIATMSTRENPELIGQERKKARIELHDNLKRVIESGECKKKQKYIAIFSVYAPALYRIIHTIYEKITGLDKKYTIK